jgi:ferredoxin
MSQPGPGPQASISVSVSAEDCLRCAACASVAPQLFAVDRGPARVLREPRTEEEHLAVRVAAALCPTRALRAAEADHG